MKRIVPGIIFLTLALTLSAEVRVREAAPTHGVNPEKITVPNPLTGPVDAQPADAVPSPGDTIRFLNGDRFHGILQSIDPQAGIQWKSPVGNQAIEFKPANIDRIRIHRPKITVQRPASNCIVRLTNNDTLPGNAVSLDTDQLSLDTWYAGRVVIQRKMLQSITFPLPGGSKNEKGWTVVPRGMPGWKYSKGATFFSTSPGCSLGRDCKLARMSSIDFDLACQEGGGAELSVAFYTESLEGFNAMKGDAYNMTISTGDISLRRKGLNGEETDIEGEVNAQILNQRNQARIGIRTDTQKGMISLMVDGVMVGKWKDPAGFPGKGGGVLFTSNETGILLSNIKVSEWNGKLEDTAIAPIKTKEDTVKLVNHDKISGSLQGIHDGKTFLATPYGTMEIPLERIAQIRMAGDKVGPARRKEGEVRLSFFEGGRLTLLLESWNSQQVIGNSPSFGKLKFSPEAFQGLQFNPYQEKPSTEGATIQEETDFEEVE